MSKTKTPKLTFTVMVHMCWVPTWEGTLGAPNGFSFFEVAFLEDPSETKIQNHSHEIRLGKLVCMLFTRYHFAVTRYQLKNR